MEINDFRRIITAFADSETDIDFSKGRLLVQIRDDVIEAGLRQHDGLLWVNEGDDELTANQWIIKRVARVQLLAERILSYVPQPEHFVTPSATLLDQPEYSDNDQMTKTADAVATIRSILGRRPGGTSSILYLTSDAGEGKTTLINQVARLQAEAYKRKEQGADWLLVPISLGGRTFLRFDDVVIGALVNRLRFQLFYFDAFIELVRMGVLIPAFDGFEEMFVESPTGEALSALGNLMSALNSSGSVLIAARKAYFEYRSLATQARLFDAIGSDSVSFARLGLERWDRSHFLEYARKRQVLNGEQIFAGVATRFSPDHPLLTRAVLVKRLLDVAATLPNLGNLIQRLGSAPQDYFFQFVDAIIEREATEKWIDRAGDPAQPLLSTAEHHLLLSMLAQEMWLTSSDGLSADVLEVVADMFSEANGKAAVIARQVRERLKQHSLLITHESNRALFSFDHEDFRKFFLGEALGKYLTESAESDLRTMLQVATLPRETCDAAIQYLKRNSGPPHAALAVLDRLSRTELHASFVRENCGALTIRLVEDESLRGSEVVRMVMPNDALRGRRISGLRFSDCYFQPTSLEGTSLTDSEFVNCKFERLEIASSTAIRRTTLRACDVLSLINLDDDQRVYDPAGIASSLIDAGFSVVDLEEQQLLKLQPTFQDEEVQLADKALRMFLRSTQINEYSIRTRLGVRANPFFDNVMPELLRSGIVEEVQYLGAGKQHRYRLTVPMQKIEQAMTASKGRFADFLRYFEDSPDANVQAKSQA